MHGTRKRNTSRAPFFSRLAIAVAIFGPGLLIMTAMVMWLAEVKNLRQKDNAEQQNRSVKKRGMRRQRLTRVGFQRVQMLLVVWGWRYSDDACTPQNSKQCSGVGSRCGGCVGCRSFAAYRCWQVASVVDGWGMGDQGGFL